MFSIYQDKKNRKYFISRKYVVNDETNTYVIHRVDGDKSTTLSYLGDYNTRDEAQEALDKWADGNGAKWIGERKSKFL